MNDLQPVVTVKAWREPKQPLQHHPAFPAASGSAVRAFSVVVTSWIPEVESIVVATNAAKAKFRAWKSAQDAGYETVKFGDLKVKRAPEFDAVADKVKHPIDRTYALLLKQQNDHAQRTGGA